MLLKLGFVGLPLTSYSAHLLFRPGVGVDMHPVNDVAIWKEPGNLEKVLEAKEQTAGVETPTATAKERSVGR